MIEVPNAVADQLHMRHGWTVLSDDVQELLRRRTRSTSTTFTQVTAIINLPAMVIVAAGHGAPGGRHQGIGERSTT